MLFRSEAIDYRSTGIGLAFAKSIVDKHHGEISVKSRRGEGSTFTVVIPASPKAFAGDDNVIYEEESNLPEPEETVAPIPETTTEDSETKESEDERPLILLVEDNAELRLNLVRFFESYFRIAEAEDGEDGLAKEIDKEQRNGMYYLEAAFEFSIDMAILQYTRKKEKPQKYSRKTGVLPF